MNILGMGPMELLLIVVIALIVFGPARLPEIMAQVGKAIGDFRRATSELSDEFNRTIQAELQETRAVVDETKATFTEAKTSIYDAHATVSSAIAGTAAPVRTAVPSAPLPAANGTSVEQHTNGAAANGTAPVLATPALADTKQWSWETSASAPPAAAPPPPAPTTAWSWDTAGPPPTHEAGSHGTPVASSAEAAPGTPNPAPPAESPSSAGPARDELVPPY